MTKEQIKTWADRFKMLGDPTRLAIRGKRLGRPIIKEKGKENRRERKEIDARGKEQR